MGKVQETVTREGTESGMECGAQGQRKGRDSDSKMT